MIQKVIVSALATVAVGQMDDDVNKRNLKNLLDHYNKVWDVNTGYWEDYGCNCRDNLDRTASGHGKAVDSLDSSCKTWKQCLKCASDVCGGDVNNSKYVVRKRRGQWVCQDDVGSCERAICECDLQFAQNSGEVAAEFDAGNWGNKFDTATCEKAQGGNFDGACCTNDEGLATWFNANKQCCADNGALYELGTCV